MKKLRIGIIGILTVAVLLMSLNIIASAFDDKKEEEKKLADAQIEIDLYKEQVELLKNELSEIKQTQYAAEKVYKDKIEELELMLSLGNKNEAVQKPQSDARYTYTVADSKVIITSYEGTDDILDVPERIDNLPVVSIGREAFKEASFSQIILPTSLEKIDWFAFSSCHNLKKISIPSSVNRIEYGAFTGVNDFTISCVENSYAHKYAKSYGFKVEIK